jgi:hypothetical protein
MFAMEFLLEIDSVLCEVRAEAEDLAKLKKEQSDIF